MKAVELYYSPSSAPCRAVMLTARAVGINFNLKYLDLQNKEQLSPEFLKVAYSLYFLYSFF